MLKYFFLATVAFLLGGCTTLSFYLQDQNTAYTAYPVEQTGRNLSVGDYQLFYDDTHFRDRTPLITFNNERSYEQIRSLSFYQKGRLLDRVRILQNFNQSTSGNTVTTIWKDESIEIADTTGAEYRYMVGDDLSSDTYLTLQLKSTVTVKKYYKTIDSKNHISTFWGFPTGFQILVNGIDFGVESLMGDNILYVSKATPLTDETALAALLSLEVQITKNQLEGGNVRLF